MDEEIKLLEGFSFYTNSRYLGIDNLKHDQILEIDSSVISKALRVMKRYNIVKLFFGAPYSKNNDISFLKDFSFLKGLSISLDNIQFEHIYNCKNLEELNIAFGYKGYANYEKFPKLKELSTNGQGDGSETMFKCRELHALSIHNFTGLTLNDLKELKALNSLTLKGCANLLSLSGVEHLMNLKRLFIGNSKVLKKINDLERLENLKELDLYKCSHIESLEPLKYLKNLKRLCLDNMGDIPSLAYLAPLKNLESFYMVEKTNVKDGELGVLERLRETGRLKNISFQNRKHYTHTAEDLGYKQSPYLEGLFGKRKQVKRKGL